jgi:hypothetical protein
MVERIQFYWPSRGCLLNFFIECGMNDDAAVRLAANVVFEESGSGNDFGLNCSVCEGLWSCSLS